MEVVIRAAPDEVPKHLWERVLGVFRRHAKQQDAALVRFIVKPKWKLKGEARPEDAPRIAVYAEVAETNLPAPAEWAGAIFKFRRGEDPEQPEFQGVVSPYEFLTLPPPMNKGDAMTVGPQHEFVAGSVVRDFPTAGDARAWMTGLCDDIARFLGEWSKFKEKYPAPFKAWGSEWVVRTRDRSETIH